MSINKDGYKKLTNKLIMKNMKRINHIASMVLFTFVAIAAGFSQPNYNDCGCPAVGSRTVVNMSSLADGNGNLTATVTNLTCNNLYKLDISIYVTDGKVLNIQAGTVIKGLSGTALNAKSLIVSQGAKIYAVGTPSCPIIFTADGDPLDGTYSTCNNNQWGGIILLGKAHNNVRIGDLHPGGAPIAYADSVGYIEGLDVPDIRHHYGAFPSTNPTTKRFYDDDNSGVLSYVSIRHGGTIIGAANEINGLTLGSVGRGTTINHIEVVSNLDDAFEFFGGTVNVDHLVALFQGDDAFDWDQYYSGKGQFLYTVQHPDTVGLLSQGSNALELDGNDVNARTPYSDAEFYNVTAIGNKVWNATLKNSGINAKANTSGKVMNSVFANFFKGYLAGSGAGAPVNFEASNNTFVNCGYLPATVAGQIVANNNVLSTTTGIDATLEYTLPCILSPSGFLNPVPANVADITPVQTLAPVVAGLVPANYRGAFAPGAEPWTKGWTYGSQLGIGLLDVTCPSDITGDGVTNGADYLILSGQFGLGCAQF
jgi:hypothetical protein